MQAPDSRQIPEHCHDPIDYSKELTVGIDDRFSSSILSIASPTTLEIERSEITQKSRSR